MFGRQVVEWEREKDGQLRQEPEEAATKSEEENQDEESDKQYWVFRQVGEDWVNSIAFSELLMVLWCVS